ncbi:MAG: OmpA family protein [Shewanella algae]|jgi:OOP family OmpA-OmpF porin|uniref:OmpA family protein n=1 Tax=Shewanella algae TaxID=38313 RepID=UPI001687B9F0|nr:outer membrane beta-barrel protein [Shewanella algae]MBO2655796.1 outer membrane beta-barrel protein [Shewanella algae]MBO2689878.1 outer membrane beta-barrel protein [Shewanella algae]MDO8254554.1 outer membrane beta-barrel protein [Shewanella algae]QNV07251.1 hypothetical protein EIY89_20180 [Shewanella algae]HEW9974318.1 outer membrane beta-barrel protein [Shewanella algae]
MKPSLFYLYIVANLFGCSLAQANTGDTAPHWYLGGDIGQSYYANGGNPEANESDRHGLAGGVHLGYQFNPYFSTELAYQYLGKAHASYDVGRVTGEFQQAVASASLGYPMFSGALTPYVKAGGSAWHGDVDELGVPLNADGFSLVYGAGLSWSFSDRMRLRLEYQFTESLGDSRTQYADHHLTTLGFSWRFGHSSKSPVVIEKPVVVERVVEKVVEVPVIEQESYVFGNGGNTLFAHDSSELLTPKVFTSVIDTLKAHPYATAMVVGHTDSSGSAQYNQKLSERRAQAVADFLVDQGIAAGRINVRGEGMNNPIVSNQTAEGRAMNRRVEITIQGHGKIPGR